MDSWCSWLRLKACCIRNRFHLHELRFKVAHQLDRNKDRLLETLLCKIQQILPISLIHYSILHYWRISNWSYGHIPTAKDLGLFISRTLVFHRRLVLLSFLLSLGDLSRTLVPIMKFFIARRLQFKLGLFWAIPLSCLLYLGVGVLCDFASHFGGE